MKDIDINEFGDYRLGLTSKEIDLYLKIKTGKRGVTQLRKIRAKFNQVAGCNTGASVKGHHVMYRHDVQRFFKLMWFGLPTYFD